MFDIENLWKRIDEANDKDGAFLEDVELIPYEGSLLIGINLRMKNSGWFILWETSGQWQWQKKMTQMQKRTLGSYAHNS